MNGIERLKKARRSFRTCEQSGKGFVCASKSERRDALLCPTATTNVALLANNLKDFARDLKGFP